jgi:uncharacterized 2Fe-2S/4Fe-4S cluster protein (DUF4445 family)
VAGVRVTFLPANVSVEAEDGADLASLAREASVDLENSCNGKGTCGKCKVRLLDGEALPPAADELALLTPSEASQGIRLACWTYVTSNARVRVLRQVDNASLRIVEDGIRADVGTLSPMVRKVYCEPGKPTLAESPSYVEAVEGEVGRTLPTETGLIALRSLPAALGTSGFKVTAILYGDEIVAIEQHDTTRECHGLAVDVGTTTVVVSLIDMRTGRELCTASTANPQGKYGQDVLSRIEHAAGSDGLRELGELIVGSVNDLTREVCAAAQTRPGAVYELIAAGNATMLHLLLGVSPASLGSSPYATVFRRGVTLGASELGLEIAEAGRVYAMPSVSAYVGADIVAGIIATGLHEATEPTLLIDIGTNGEIVFGSRDGLVACSCAAGPAFEGMNIECGTVAVDGAIEEVRIEGSVKIGTIGSADPVGICGSGIIDAVAQLLSNGLVHRSGCFLEPDEFLSSGGHDALAERMAVEGDPKFFLTYGAGKSAATSDEGIFISQKDVRQVQLAKGAILSGIHVLLEEVGVELSDVARVYVAGAFGKHSRLDSLIRIGVVPDELADRVVFVGNTSKTGAVLSLLSTEMRMEAERVARETKYFELSIHPRYEQLFIEALTFPC